MSSTATATYPIAPAIRLRLFGMALLALAALTLSSALLASLLDQSWILTVTITLAVLLLVGLSLALGPQHWIVRLEPLGYSTRFLRDVGARSARWKDVDEMTATTKGEARCIILQLRDGRSTTIPVDALGRGGQSFAEEITRRLNGAA